MKNKIVYIIIIIFITGTIFILTKKENKPVGPTLTTQTAIPTPTPTPALKTFKFDGSTDLKKELEQINPKVLDVDFE